MKFRDFILLFVFAVGLMAFLPTNLSAAPPADFEAGEKLFVSKCKACHNMDRKLIGPALQDVHLRRDSAWIFKFINGSQAMVEAGDSTAKALFAEFNQIPMPDQGVSEGDFANLFSYLKTASLPPAFNPIARPESASKRIYDPLSFYDWYFWVPFTLGIIMLVITLYYQTVVADLRKSEN